MPKISPAPAPAPEPVHDSSSAYWEIGGHPNYLLSVDERVVAARELLAQVADTSVTIMLGGERGVGKEVLARGIHNMSSRRDSPFVALNAYAVPKAAIARELFGNGSPGKLQSVGDGTLLVHGLELLPEEVRAGLLEWKRRSVREGRSERAILSYEHPSLGHDELNAIERAWSAAGGAVRVDIPALRDRREDIPLLANHVLQKYSTFYSSRIRVLRSSFVRFLQAYRWPGNTRELERVIRRYLVIEDEEAIRTELGSKQGSGSLAEEELLDSGARLRDIVAQAVARVEARAIAAALQRSRWNKKRAAVELGISYKSLLNKIHQYHLES